jgi:hypothetical protein
MRTRMYAWVVCCVSALCLLILFPAVAQSSEEMGKLRIHVVPKQAYVFVDGKAIREGNQTIPLAAGSHKVGIYNYGYLPKEQNVEIRGGETENLDVALQLSGDKVAGPFALIEFKGDPRAAVLLNGQTPAYFVGHVDEFDWNWIWHQRLLVHPGTYQVMVTREGNTIWSGQVRAEAGKQVTVHLDHNGAMQTKDWKEGLTMGPQPRFHAGIASATVPVAPVSAQLAAKTTDLACGQSTTLDWKAADAVDTSISGLGQVPEQGDKSVSPTHEMTYVLTAVGPGGKATQTVTVHVKSEPAATLALSQPVVHYRKVGDKVLEQDSATLDWAVTNANSVTIDPLGKESEKGSTKVVANPKQATKGPVNEDVTYRLTASSPCGGTVTKTATLHIVGSIEPPPSATLASLFYPTAYPTKKHPKIGLVASEKATLANAATQFKNYLVYDSKASLVIVGHADIRGSRKYNKALSERRAELARTYLISKGVSADKIRIEAKGKDQQIGAKEVQALQAKDDQKPEKWMVKHTRATWMAYNRRADIVLKPENIQSTVLYPNDIAAARVLWQLPMAKLSQVMKLSNEPATTIAQAHTSGNQK